MPSKLICFCLVLLIISWVVQPWPLNIMSFFEKFTNNGFHCGCFMQNLSCWSSPASLCYTPVSHLYHSSLHWLSFYSNVIYNHILSFLLFTFLKSFYYFTYPFQLLEYPHIHTYIEAYKHTYLNMHPCIHMYILQKHTLWCLCAVVNSLVLM